LSYHDKEISVAAAPADSQQAATSRAENKPAADMSTDTLGSEMARDTPTTQPQQMSGDRRVITVFERE